MAVDSVFTFPEYSFPCLKSQTILTLLTPRIQSTSLITCRKWTAQFPQVDIEVCYIFFSVSICFLPGKFAENWCWYQELSETIFQVIISSTEHEMLMVSCCDRSKCPSSVVWCQHYALNGISFHTPGTFDSNLGRKYGSDLYIEIIKIVPIENRRRGNLENLF